MANNNQDLIEAKKLLFELNQLREKLGKGKLNLLDADLLKVAKDLPNDIKSARRELEGMADSMSGLYGSLRGITSEFKGQASVLNKVRGAFRQLEDIAQDLKFDEQEINDLNASQLKKLEEKFKKNQQILGQEARALINQNNHAKSLNGLVNTLKQQGKTQDEINDYISGHLKTLKDKLNPEEKSLLQLYYDQGNTLDEINKKIEDRIQKEKEINKALGVGGAVVQGINSLMGKLGMNSGIFSDAVQDAEEAMRNAAKDGGSRLQVLMAGLGPLAKGLGRALTDPAVLIEKILTGFLEVNKASVQLERLTGQNSQALAGANFEAATTVDVLTVAAELTQQLGVNAQNAFSSDVLAGAAGLKNEMGLAADEAGGLAVVAQTTTGDINGMVDGIVETTSAFNKANRSAVSQGQVLRDVAKTSDSIKLSLGNNPKLIAQAASAARRLGMELGDVDKIAESLLNFEDSISAELEAELLTGKQLNLEKARELALKNDLVGLGNELFKNSADINEFGKMNRIQQESYAKALGMTRDQLARVAYQKALDNKMTDEQAAAAAGVSAEQMRQMDVQERISKALDKLAQAFAPILDIIADIADILGAIITPIAGAVGYAVKLLNSFGALKPILAAIALYFVGGAIAKGIGTMVGGVMNFGKALRQISAGGILDKIKSLGGKFSEGMAGKGGGVEDKTGKLAENARDKVSGKEGGGGFKNSMKNLADGLKEMGSKGVIQGIVNLALAGPALLLAVPSIPYLLFMGKADLSKLPPNFTALASGLQAMSGTGLIQGIINLALAGPALLLAVPSIPFLLFMGKVDLKKLALNFAALATGLQAMSTTFVGSLALAAFGIAGLIAIPSLIFLGGIALVGELAAIGLAALAGGLLALGSAAATGLPFLAIALIGALGLAMIPFGIALGKAAPAIQAFGTVITSVFTGLATLIPVIVDSFIKLITSIGEGLGPLLLLGPALFGIAAGLGAVALAGLTALPAIGGLVLLSKAAPALVSLGIGGGEKSAGSAKKEGEGGSMAALEAKFDTLIELVRQGTTINLDGSKIATSVGRNLPLVSTATS